MIKTLVLPDQIHNYAHNEEWLIRTWNEQGRASDGIGLAKSLIENPRHPTYNTLDKLSNSASYGRTRLLETMLKWELWDELLKINNTPLMEKTVQTGHETTRLRAVGIAQYQTKKNTELAETIKALEALEKKEIEDSKKPKEEIKKGEPAKKEDKVEKVAVKAPEPAKKDDKPKSANVASKSSTPAKPADAKKEEPKKPQQRSPQKAIAEALAELRALKLIIDKAKPEEIRTALDKASETPKSRLIRYWLAIGDNKKASELADKATQDLDGFIAQTEAYVADNKLDAAKKSFEKVRDRSYAMDKDLPVNARLTALATKLDIKGDWRKPAPQRSDSGKRPTLDSLGPVHWSAPAAPAWSGTDMKGKPISSADFKGKPTLLIFYVGHTCSHCMQQLQTFETVAEDFKKQGIEIIAISPDSVEEAPLANKFAKTKGGFPFKLVSAKGIETFQAYRAYDDFEKLPLHVVAIVDAKQQLRWLDVGYKPFMEAKFTLEEAKRLLALPELGGVAAR
jgi:peroxiredoxin